MGNFGTLTNTGTITLSNDGQYSTGIYNSFYLPGGRPGEIANDARGTITIDNSGVDSVGLLNDTSGTIYNSGTVTDESSGFVNYGTVVGNPIS